MRVLKVLLAACLPALVAPSAWAHAVAGSASRNFAWSFDPLILTAIGFCAACYAIGAVRLRRRAGRERVLGRPQVAAFSAGLATLFVALCSPLDTVAEQLFWVHMIQHLMLIMLAAPLLVMGRPVVAALWALPMPARKGIGRGWGAAGFAAMFRLLMQPISVWFLFCGVFAFWHFPGPYQIALRNEAVHTIEHVSFLLSALAFWTLVIEPIGPRRLGYGGALMLVMTTAVISGLPGMLMIFAPHPLYPAHAAGAAAWNLTLMEDQQLAGLVMWIPAGLAYVGAAAWLFVRWLHQAEVRADARSRRAAALFAMLLLVPTLGLSGCEKSSKEAQSERFPGDPDRGSALISQVGCGSCHIIPGISGANGLVGPPLMKFSRRIYIAGLLRNTPPNLVHWLRDPQSVVPGNAMPNLGLSETQAQDIAAYLHTLR